MRPRSLESRKWSGWNNNVSCKGERVRTIGFLSTWRPTAIVRSDSLLGQQSVDYHQTHTLAVGQIRRLRRRLLRWGRVNYQNYPWRLESDAWLTFAAEIFLQRTRARQVERVYGRFSKRYTTPTALLDANVSELSQVMRPLGLAFRIELIQEIARLLVERGGRLPESLDELTRFNGVGMYTASAWLSLHRGKRAVIIDSNVARWLSRMTGNSYNRDPRHVSWIKDLAEEMTPSRVFKEYNYAVLDFTMLVCTPRKPSCEMCPIRDDCSYNKSSSTF